MKTRLILLLALMLPRLALNASAVESNSSEQEKLSASLKEISANVESSKPAEDDEKSKSEASDEVKKKAAAEAAEVSADNEAKKKAEAEAAKLAADDEAEKKAEAEAAKVSADNEAKKKAAAAAAAKAVDSPVQASARPFNLAIVDTVKIGGSDEASLNFRLNVLPSITNLININLRETLPLKNATAMMLDPSQLKLKTDSAIRVYFVGEGAGYHNTLAFNFYLPGVDMSAQAASRDVITAATKIIFPDASSSVSSYDPLSKVVRTASNPLIPADFVDLGNYKAGGRLDLALIANGANGGRDVFVASPARNPDHIAHVVSFALKNSPYLIAAFEDLRGGGDRDYNDVVVAIDIGRANVAKMVSAPVPPLGMTLAAFMGVAAIWRRRLGRA